jgi:hypothetical protein
MINYTERLSALMQDVIARVEPLAFIRMPEIIVFARQGRADAAGAFATCHSLNMPTSDPGYYFWRDRASGRLTRRSEWFVTTTPEVYLGSTRIKYLISFALPRFCEQSLTGSRKAAHYDGADRWIAKLDTVVHELYHIDPRDTGIRQMERTDGTYSPATHGPLFYSDVARMVKLYLASSPRPEMYDFLRFDFAGLEKKYGNVVATTFRNYPSFPQRYAQPLDVQPDGPGVQVVSLKPSTQPPRYTAGDLLVRPFSPAF